MTEILETVRIAEAADVLWRRIGGFGSVANWHPLVHSVESAGGLRVAVTKGGGPQVDRLIEDEPREHRYRYRMEVTSLPVRDYIGELCVEEAGPNASTVAWKARFEALDQDEADAAEMIRSFIRTGLDALAERHGRAKRA